jgi:hypothetical protein
MAEAWENASIRKSTACTGLRAVTTRSAEISSTAENRKKKPVLTSMVVGKIRCDSGLEG